MKTTLKIIPALFMSLIGTSAYAQFLEPTGITAKVISVKIVDRKTDIETIDDQGHTQEYLISANLQLKLKITDAVCSLKENSKIYTRYSRNNTPLKHGLKSTVDLYIESEYVEIGCGSENNTEKTEIITIPLVNGLDEYASKDTIYTFTLNRLTSWGVKPTTIKVMVNQSKNSVFIKK